MNTKRNKTERNKETRLKRNNSTYRSKTLEHYSENRKYESKLIETKQWQKFVTNERIENQT
jgi:hypothetical protein